MPRGKKLFKRHLKVNLIVLPSIPFVFVFAFASVSMIERFGHIVLDITNVDFVCRSLALLPGVGVVSASHDMTLKLWDFQGNVVSHFIGHTAIIYNVATSSSGLIASASEDFTARIWQASGENIAVIQHPGLMSINLFSQHILLIFPICLLRLNNGQRLKRLYALV